MALSSDLMIWRYVSALHRQYHRYLAKRMRALGLSASEYPFMIFLSSDSMTSQREMSETLSIDEGLTASAVKSLERKGYIRRNKSSADKRIYQVQLTEEGEALRREIVDIVECWAQMVLKPLPKDRIDQFYHDLRLISEHAEDVLKECE